MRQATIDRGEIIHFAGQHGLSPALRDGVPAFASGRDAAARCGWEAFFAALEARDLALDWDPEDPASASFVPRREARARLSSHGPGGGLARSARFLSALLGRGAPG